MHDWSEDGNVEVRIEFAMQLEMLSGKVHYIFYFGPYKIIEPAITDALVEELDQNSSRKRPGLSRHPSARNRPFTFFSSSSRSPTPMMYSHESIKTSSYLLDPQNLWSKINNENQPRLVTRIRLSYHHPDPHPPRFFGRPFFSGPCLADGGLIDALIRNKAV